MFDNKTEFLLRLIDKKCENGSFKVLSFEEIALAFPQSLNVDIESIKQLTKLLKDTGYVNVRYDSVDEICIAPTAKGREFCELKSDLPNERVGLFVGFWSYFYLFITIFAANAVTVFLCVIIWWIYAVA